MKSPLALLVSLALVVVVLLQHTSSAAPSGAGVDRTISFPENAPQSILVSGPQQQQQQPQLQLQQQQQQPQPPQPVLTAQESGPQPVFALMPNHQQQPQLQHQPAQVVVALVPNDQQPQPPQQPGAVNPGPGPIRQVVRKILDSPRTVLLPTLRKVAEMPSKVLNRLFPVNQAGVGKANNRQQQQQPAQNRPNNNGVVSRPYNNNLEVPMLLEQQQQQQVGAIGGVITY